MFNTYILKLCYKCQIQLISLDFLNKVVLRGFRKILLHSIYYAGLIAWQISKIIASCIIKVAKIRRYFLVYFAASLFITKRFSKYCAGSLKKM